MTIVNETTPTEAEGTNEMPVEDRRTWVASRAPFTEEERAFAEQEGTLRLETRYVRSQLPQPENFKTPDGHSYRNAGNLYIRTCGDGVRRFVAYMHADSVHHDFRYFDRMINDARFGRMDGWKRHTFNNGDEVWIFDYPNYATDSLHEFKPASIIDESSWGYPCSEPRCREDFHEDEDGSHTLEVLEDQPTSRGSYEIEICKDATRPDSAWYLNLWMNGDLTELTPAQVAKLANDLNWMSIECETTNAKETRKLRRPVGVDEQLMGRDV
ncbi:hypothetical protein [Microbacterium paludicola]|uniref:hypothetical protein n=1 Tax=Microbacterium paludicola TaxID=300019 RepID=UPI0011A4D4DE|nr:hypothetical protein [Microbacterium paludicola]